MLYGFGISGYRSFGPDPQFIAPLGRINVFAGQNNVGKSNVLRALRLVAWILKSGRTDALAFDATVDSHQGKREAQMTVYLPIPLEESSLRTYLRKVHSQPAESLQARTIVEILKTIDKCGQGAAWYGRRGNEPGYVTPRVEDFPITLDGTRRRLAGGISEGHWHQAWSALFVGPNSDLIAHHIPQTLDRLSPFHRADIPAIHSIEPFRQIGKPDSAYAGHNGDGLIARLSELQLPEHELLEDRKKFDAIQEFVRTVTGCRNAQINIPHSKRQIILQMDGKPLKIESLGTGLHQVIIFAAAATAYEDQILLLEEPEIHLHPRLQRRLLSYLRDHTKNQYLITTHSTHLLDAEGVTRFHVQLNEHGETVVKRVDTPGGRASVCFDLGYRPSDLVQANCIVWVEGPSDRIYLNAWIKAVDPTLVEGDHYSIMFYGGRLLSHLTISDQSVIEFIELQRLNRRVAILMDSDRRQRGTPLGATKERVQQETKGHGGFVWVTAGREVENYLPATAIKLALENAHPGVAFKQAKNEWACAYEPAAAKGPKADKVKVARAAVENVDLSVLDLRDRIDGLVAFIRESNH